MIIIVIIILFIIIINKRSKELEEKDELSRDEFKETKLEDEEFEEE